MKALELFYRLKTRSLIVFLLVLGVFILALIDETGTSREGFVQLALVGVGGYLGQLIPKRQNEQ